MKLNEVIGTGAQATVYCSGNYAVKLFKENYDKAAVFYEAFVNSIIEVTGMPVPKVYEVLNIGSQMAIKMDYLKGISLNDRLLEDTGNEGIYIEHMVDLQAKMHSKQVSLPNSLKDRLKKKISKNQELDEIQKEKLLSQLEALPDGNELCHGDFHGYNILLSKGAYWIIDWVDSTYGCADGDACRTYMIYSLYVPKLAELYLSLYCNNTSKKKEQILVWLPVVAAARLSENISNEKEKLMSWINKV